MRLWVISEFYFPNQNTTSYIITKIAEGLCDNIDVSVITSTAASSGNSYENIAGVEIYRVRSSNLNKNDFLKRTFKLILLGYRLFSKAVILIKKGDSVLCVTNPATIVFLIRVLRIFKNFRLFFLVHDVFPENLVVAKVLKPRNILYRITLFLYNWAYSKADKLIVIGRDMELYMRNKLGRICPPTEYIPNFADVKLIRPQSRENNRLLIENRLLDKFVLLYTGNVGRAQDITNLMDTMILMKKHKKIHLLIVGDGANISLIKKNISEFELNNITLIPPMNREFANDFLNAGDIGLVSLQPGRKGIAVPSKTYTFLAAGKPILSVVDKDSEVYQMINESKCGWWSPPGDPTVLCDLILEISNSKEIVNSKSKIARRVAEEKYSFEKVLSQFKNSLYS